MGLRSSGRADADLEGSQSVSELDSLPIIESVKAEAGHRLRLSWRGRDQALVDMKASITHPAFRSLEDEDVFRRVQVGDWGHSLVWPNDVEMGAVALCLESLTSWGRDDTRAFLEWRLRHGLSSSAAAEALGLSRRLAAQYSSDRLVPLSILLACWGWEALRAA